MVGAWLQNAERQRSNQPLEGIMRILITGGAGFIGSHLCDRLLQEGHSVLVYDNLITGAIENIEPFRSHPRFTFVCHNITEIIELDGPLDRIYHFASPASPVDYAELPIQTLKVGALGTHNALGLAKAKGARLLLASTSEVYGDPLVHPQPETYWGNVNPIGPRSCYDEAKRFGEAITMAYHKHHGVETRIVRIFNTYGPRMRTNDGRAIPNFLSQALKGEPITVYGDGSQTRSFCYVDDLVEGLLRLMESDVDTPVNIGNPTELSLLEMATRVKERTGSSSEIVFKPLPQDDPKVRRPDITKARECLGWEPQVGLEEGLGKTVAYFRKALLLARSS
jgi:dTDP-glucose 4,6-dehydratase